SIVLRRTKKGKAADLALPSRIVTLRRDTLDMKEEDYYTSLYNESQAQFNTLVTFYDHILVHWFDAKRLLFSRVNVPTENYFYTSTWAVDHPYLVIYSKTATGRIESVIDARCGEQVCGLCHEPIEDPVRGIGPNTHKPRSENEDKVSPTSCNNEKSPGESDELNLASVEAEDSDNGMAAPPLPPPLLPPLAQSTQECFLDRFVSSHESSTSYNHHSEIPGYLSLQYQLNYRLEQAYVIIF
ncbi:hypothetical protein U1Q18_000098, partial [Sarracenia purpurea var. burkii]